jgi:hypothetical protein
MLNLNVDDSVPSLRVTVISLLPTSEYLVDIIVTYFVVSEYETTGFAGREPVPVYTIVTVNTVESASTIVGRL